MQRKFSIYKKELQSVKYGSNLQSVTFHPQSIIAVLS